jgi:hypothetical protein
VRLHLLVFMLEVLLSLFELDMLKVGLRLAEYSAVRGWELGPVGRFKSPSTPTKRTCGMQLGHSEGL